MDVGFPRTGTQNPGPLPERVRGHFPASYDVPPNREIHTQITTERAESCTTSRHSLAARSTSSPPPGPHPRVAALSSASPLKGVVVDAAHHPPQGPRTYRADREGRRHGRLPGGGHHLPERGHTAPAVAQ